MRPHSMFVRVAILMLVQINLLQASDGWMAFLDKDGQPILPTVCYIANDSGEQPQYLCLASETGKNGPHMALPEYFYRAAKTWGCLDKLQLTSKGFANYVGVRVGPTRLFFSSYASAGDILTRAQSMTMLVAVAFDNSDATSHIFRTVIKSSPYLRQVMLGPNATMSTDLCLSDLAFEVPSLNSLWFENVSANKKWLKTIQCFFSLKRLVFSSVDFKSGSLNFMLASLPSSLEFLSLKDIHSIGAKKDWLEGDEIMRLGQSCPALKFLDLGCLGISPKSIRELSHLGRLTCLKMTMRGLAAEKLDELMVQLIEYRNSWPNMKCLAIGCHSGALGEEKSPVSDIEALSRAWPNLRSFHFYGLTYNSKQMYETVLKSFPLLEELGVEMRGGVTLPVLDQLLQDNFPPRLKIVTLKKPCYDGEVFIENEDIENAMIARFEGLALRYK